MTSQPSAPWRLDGSVALVTGAARGIGAAIARQLAGLGASLALADLEGMDPAEQASQLRSLGAARVSVHRLDVRDTSSCTALVADVARQFGGLDILINNAGVNARHDFAAASEEEWHEVLDVNLGGTIRMCRAAVRLLRAAPAPAVVNLGSTAGAVAVAGSAAYGVSKAAIMHLTKILALEWAPAGIRVNAVAPSIVPTAMTEDVRQSNEYMTAKLATIPLGRMVTREEVAQAVAYLCSPAAAMTTGQTLFVDGGVTVQ
ncbi:MAG: SDR family oxidoreductase [Actinobacteria bacterium]|nr:SDR family oxidoreductase [Actinomycetota bacterium]MBO0814169.1 SDR family oxidoreductase [Actinomycetota bacterium]